jgi:hypothetical protein
MQRLQKKFPDDSTSIILAVNFGWSGSRLWPILWDNTVLFAIRWQDSTQAIWTNPRFCK